MTLDTLIKGIGQEQNLKKIVSGIEEQVNSAKAIDDAVASAGLPAKQGGRISQDMIDEYNELKTALGILSNENGRMYEAEKYGIIGSLKPDKLAKKVLGVRPSDSMKDDKKRYEAHKKAYDLSQIAQGLGSEDPNEVNKARAGLGKIVKEYKESVVKMEEEAGRKQTLDVLKDRKYLTEKEKKDLAELNGRIAARKKLRELSAYDENPEAALGAYLKEVEDKFKKTFDGDEGAIANYARSNLRAISDEGKKGADESLGYVLGLAA